MVDLGTKIKDGVEQAYPTMGKRKDYVSYRSITVDMKILNGKTIKMGDKICVEVVGVVTGINQSEYCNDFTLEIHEGEVESAEDEKKESLLGGE